MVIAEGENAAPLAWLVNRLARPMGGCHWWRLIATGPGGGYPAGVVEPNQQPPRYRWPWFVLGAFLLAVVLAVAWMAYAVHLERQARNFNPPQPGAAPR